MQIKCWQDIAQGLWVSSRGDANEKVTVRIISYTDTNYPIIMSLFSQKLKFISIQTYMWIFICNYLLRVSITGTKQHDQKQFGEKGHPQRNSGREPWGSHWYRRPKESSLLACSPGLVQPAFLCPPRKPAQGWHHPLQDVSTNIINQELIN